MTKIDNQEQWLALPRGIRNNNPGNIRRVKGQKWQGELPKEEVIARGWVWDERFVQFDDMVYGLRAIWKTLRTYYDVHGLDTIEKIISRWAPVGDNNNTEGYIRFVSDYACTARNESLFPSWGVLKTYDSCSLKWSNIILGICVRECSYLPSDKAIELAWLLAFSPSVVDTMFRDKDNKIVGYLRNVDIR